MADGLDPRQLIPVRVARCSCCSRTDKCVRFPIRFGPYSTTVDLCEVCLKVGGAAFDVAATLELEDAVRNRAGRLGRPS